MLGDIKGNVTIPKLAWMIAMVWDLDNSFILIFLLIFSKLNYFCIDSNSSKRSKVEAESKSKKYGEDE